MRYTQHTMRYTLIFLLFLAMPAAAAVKDTPTHIDPDRSPRGCSGCHMAHGKPATPMMRDFPDKLCLICHGPFKTDAEDQATDVSVSLQKRSRHPVAETAQYHRPGEELPELDPSARRHVSCYDCHEPHTLRNDKKMGKMKGISFAGTKKIAERDSEVCYKCHADSFNKPATSGNMRLLFDPGNKSYHPVEKAAKGKSVSLIKTIVQGSTMQCTDCHESHGSDYPPLLRKNYNTTDGAESFFAYELCYTCHRRESILANESFTGSATNQYGHREHIVFQRTSCHTCHAAHGTQMNQSLIEFDRAVVSGAGQYIPAFKGTATCVLTCHGKDHGVAPSPKQQLQQIQPSRAPRR